MFNFVVLGKHVVELIKDYNVNKKQLDQSEVQKELAEDLIGIIGVFVVNNPVTVQEATDFLNLVFDLAAALADGKISKEELTLLLGDVYQGVENFFVHRVSPQ